MTVIEAIGSNGFLLPPMIILAAKQHQASWYQNLCPDWTIGVSETGWTNDQLGKNWLEAFNKHTKARTAGAYRLLILDGHGSHATAEFDHFCNENKIICLYLPPHSSHLLQPLDVACFGPLKHAYGQQIQNFMKLGINHIDKDDFLEAYQTVRPGVFTTPNINASFAGAGLIPYNPGRVLDSLHFQSDMTPPGSSHSKSSSSWTAGTPKTTKDLKKQGGLVRHLLGRRTASPCPVNQAVNQVIKGCEIAMNNAVLLDHEVYNLRMANQRQKRKRETSKTYIASGGVLTGAEGQQRVQEVQEVDREVAEDGERPRKRAPPQCTNCHLIGHNRTSCPTRPRHY